MKENTPHIQEREMILDSLNRMSRGKRLDLKHSVLETAYSEGLRVDNTPVPVFAIPTLYEREDIEVQLKNIETVHTILHRLEDFAFHDPSYLARGIRAKILETMPPFEQILVSQSTSGALARFRNTRSDTFLTPSGARIIEANTTCPEALVFHRALMKSAGTFFKKAGLEDLYRQTALQRENTADKKMLQTLLQAYGSIRGGDAPKSVGIVYHAMGKGSGLNATELPILAEDFEKAARDEYGLSLSCTVGEPEQLETARATMALDGNPVDMVWKNNLDFEGRDPHDPSLSAFREISRDPYTFPLINDSRGIFAGAKALFAYLCDPDVQKALGIRPDEAAVIGQTVPITVMPSLRNGVRVNGCTYSALEYVTQDPSQWLIKPIFGTHGEGVIFGKNDPDAFLDALSRSENDPRIIVQQFVDYKSIQATIPSIGDDGELVTVDAYRDFNVHIIGDSAPDSWISRAMQVPEENGGRIQVLNVAQGVSGVQAGFAI